MFTLDRRQQWALVAVLALLMAATRSHHFATLKVLPDASWAVFFLAGFLITRWGVLVVLLVVAGLADAVAIGLGGVSDFCLSFAYPFLIPAYTALGLGGRWLGRVALPDGRLLPRMGLAIFASAFVCELIASGSFHFLSGVIAEPTLAGFGTALWRYFPRSLANFVLYLGFAAPLVVWFAWAQSARSRRADTLRR